MTEAVGRFALGESDPEAWGHDWPDGKGYILAGQQSLFGDTREVVGFGTRDAYVRTIPRDVANDVVRANHYSGGFYSGSRLHFGVYIAGAMLGVLQFGASMNPAKYHTVVAGTLEHEYLELNRMWLRDDAPHSSESQAIRNAVKVIRRTLPRVAWVQSFADERCGRFGVVYQAAGFTYHGEHVGVFWRLPDGSMVHDSLMTRDPSLRPKAAAVQAVKHEAVPLRFRQFRYLLFLRQGFASRCCHERLPYPKPEGEA